MKIHCLLMNLQSGQTRTDARKAACTHRRTHRRKRHSTKKIVATMSRETSSGLDKNEQMFCLLCFIVGGVTIGLVGVMVEGCVVKGGRGGVSSVGVIGFIVVGECSGGGGVFCFVDGAVGKVVVANS